MKPDISHITEALRASWSPETSTWGEDLPVDNPARGQCAVSSLVVQDFLGGDLFRVRANGDGIDEKHYYNVLDDGTVIDTTREQYQGKVVSLTPAPVDLEGKYVSIREKVLDNEDTRKRYELLRQLVNDNLQKGQLYEH
jgi:hypothetical protein